MAAVTGAALLGGRSFGWWQLSSSGVVAVAAAVAIAVWMVVVFVPAVELLENWREEHRVVYWAVFVVAIILSGIVIDVASTWLIKKGAP